jgi:hypothetical protein
MELETPRSPGHCLGMLNAHMRTDMLRHVHDGVRTRRDQQDATQRGRSRRQSPLDMLIARIKDVVATFDGTALFASVGPNPFNCDPRYRCPVRGFEPEPAYRHDIALLKSQLASLREIRASLDTL